MKTKQVFEAYDRRDDGAPETLEYCARCGAKSDFLVFDRHTSFRCPRCRFTLYKNPSPGVVVLIVENDRVLLGKRSLDVFMGGKWSLPGGFIEFNEDFLSAAHREIIEETNLSIEVLSLLSVVSNFLSPALHTIVVVLLAKKTSGILKPGDDMVRLEWFPLSGPLPPMAFEADEHIIDRYYQTKTAGTPVDLRFSLP